MRRSILLGIVVSIILIITTAFPLKMFCQSLGASTDARVPRLIRFSGTLRPAGEKPASGVAELSFSLFKEESGGEPLWFESQTVEVDALGRYNVLLGAMHADGLPMDLFTSGEARWLSIMVGKIEQPRVLLVSVPYALKAGDAATLGGKPATAFVATEQLKEQVASALSDPEAGRTLTTVVARASSGSDTPPAVINETVPATFTCATAGNCVKVTQDGVGNALFATQNGAGDGLRSVALNTAVNGISTAVSGSTFGVRGQSSSTSGIGVFGQAMAATGTTYGLRGDSASTGGRGIFGFATAATGATYGIFGAAASTSGVGLYGQATAVSGSTIGVRGESRSASGVGGMFDNLGGGKLISARTTGFIEKFSVSGVGNVTAAGSVSGTQFISNMVSGTPPLQVTSSTLVPNLYVARANVADIATSAINLAGVAAASYARLDSGNSFSAIQSVVASGPGATALDVQATDLTAANTAVYGLANGQDGSGVIGEANNGAVAVGVWGRSTSGLAGQFDGNVNVSGTLSKTGGSFKIDHPLDPANRYLLHSFVESPDMMNIYNGNLVLDTNGKAVIELPHWFEALNKDFRYQLTAIGSPGPNLYVAAEIRDNRFEIAGGSAGMKVSWQVTGVRKDAWANSHRIPVEVQKTDNERGFFLHPELVGAPAEKGILWAHHPEMMRRTSPR